MPSGRTSGSCPGCGKAPDPNCRVLRCLGRPSRSVMRVPARITIPAEIVRRSGHGAPLVHDDRDATFVSRRRAGETWQAIGRDHGLSAPAVRGAAVRYCIRHGLDLAVLNRSGLPAPDDKGFPQRHKRRLVEGDEALGGGLA